MRVFCLATPRQKTSPRDANSLRKSQENTDIPPPTLHPQEGARSRPQWSRGGCPVINKEGCDLSAGSLKVPARSPCPRGSPATPAHAACAPRSCGRCSAPPAGRPGSDGHRLHQISFKSQAPGFSYFKIFLLPLLSLHAATLGSQSERGAGKAHDVKTNRSPYRFLDLKRAGKVGVCS